MPDLPTLTVTTEQANRMIAAYAPRDPTKTAQQNYRDWLKERIIEYVIQHERQARLIAFHEEEEATEEQTVVDLGGTLPPDTP
jgi:hypothetical protein